MNTQNAQNQRQSTTELERLHAIYTLENQYTIEPATHLVAFRVLLENAISQKAIVSTLSERALELTQTVDRFLEIYEKTLDRQTNFNTGATETLQALTPVLKEMETALAELKKFQEDHEYDHTYNGSNHSHNDD